MRVVTQYGIGGINGAFVPEYETIVSIREPEEQTVTLGPAEIFPFGLHALVRVIQTEFVIASIQMHENRDQMLALYQASCPTNETRILLDLEAGTFSAPRDFASVMQTEGYDFLFVFPWIDRWAREDSEMIDTKEGARQRFDEELDVRGTSGGIGTGVILDLAERSILGFLIMVPSPQCVIWHKIYE